VFAAFKIIGSLLLACASIVAAIAGSGHPLFFGCLFVAFGAGALGAEIVRAHRRHSVRSSIK
jgi:hypothetical protein